MQGSTWCSLSMQDQLVGRSPRLHKEEQLGQERLQLIDGPAFYSCALEALFNEAPPHGLQSSCMQKHES